MCHSVLRAVPGVRSFALGLLLAGTLGASCATEAPDDPPGPEPAVRTYRMGFSGFPPKPVLDVAVASLTMWSQRADAAIYHVEPPWKLLLAGGDLTAWMASEYAGQVAFYRGRNFPLFVTFDLTDGLARDKEARELRELGRSIAEPAVQQRLRDFVRLWVATFRPEYVGLGAETNLIRLSAPRPVYDALRVLAAAAAGDVRATLPSATLYTTVQAEVAWGRLQRSGTYVGIEQDFADFPWIQALGVSSYPYLGGFASPDDIPADYFARLPGTRSIPLFVSEGGWSSANVPGVNSSPLLQAGYVRRMATLLDRANALAWLQLNFADMDLRAWTVPAGYDDVLSLFVRIGMVDSELRPKPALAVWDSVFAMRRR